MEIEITLGKDHQIIAPRLHDSKIKKIEFAEDQVDFTFELENKDLVGISFSGQVHLKANNLLEGNIVLDMTIQREFQNEKLNYIELNPSYGCEATIICQNIRAFALD